jgi:predicted DNA-binding transcriptional regulator YafY
VRSFRLSRLLSAVKEVGPAAPVPQGFESAGHVEAGPWGLGAPAERARVSFSPKVAWWAIGTTPGANVVRRRRDGWIEVDVPASENESFVSWVLSFGPEIRILAPRTVRDAVVARLEALA